jgi:hypothetical protein
MSWHVGPTTELEFEFEFLVALAKEWCSCTRLRVPLEK